VITSGGSTAVSFLVEDCPPVQDMTPATSTSTHGDLRERMSQACHHCGFGTPGTCSRRCRPTGGSASRRSAWPRPTRRPHQVRTCTSSPGRHRDLEPSTRSGFPSSSTTWAKTRRWSARCWETTRRRSLPTGCTPLDRLCHQRCPGLAGIRCHPQGHHALRHDLAGGRRPPSLGEGPVGGSLLTRREPIRRARTRWFLRGNGRSVTNRRVRRTHRHP
jgi:hypothetical protein